MKILLIISFATALAWLIKDWVEQKSNFSIKASWKKYVGCLIAGLLYTIFEPLSFFHWIAVIGVIALFGSSFDAVLNFINYLLGKVGAKKIS